MSTGVWFLIFLILGLILWGIYKLKISKKFNSFIDDWGDFFFPDEPYNFNDNSLTLISMGSLVGMGLATVITSFVGGNMFVGIVIILVGLHSFKQHIHLTLK